MIGGYSGRPREKALAELRNFLRENGPTANALKSLRGPMSQAELAAEAGVSQPMIAAVESGAKRMPDALGAEIAQALGVGPGTLTTAIRLGELRQALEADPGEGGGSLVLLVVELLALVEQYVPPGELQLQLRELLTNSLAEAAVRDRERLRELKAKEAAASKVATKSRRRKAPDRDVHGRRVHKPIAESVRGAQLLGIGLKSREQDGRIVRDSFGINKSKSNGR